MGEHLRGLPGAGSSKLIALDGRTVRASIGPRNPRGEHLLSAYLPAQGLTLEQRAIGGKHNEIGVAPALVAELELRGKVVAADALTWPPIGLFVQRKTSRRLDLDW